MLLQISTTHLPATDLGYLLHKHPDKFQTFELSVGKVHFFYPEMTEQRATACLLLEVDSVGLVRGAGKESDNFALAHYVNDRPYVASSFMSVAIAKTLSSAMNGKSKERPELLGVKMPFEVLLTALPAPRGGESLIRKLFEPLGYAVEVERHLLDEKIPEWGYSKYFMLRLQHTITLQELLSHLYVLIPVLDNQKHYFIGESEIEKLIQKGEGWLAQHPEKEQITRRYLQDLPALSRLAMERLGEGEILPEADEDGKPITEAQKRKDSLHDKRLQTVTQKLVESGAEMVADLGCGEGKLIRILLKHKQFTKILGIDVSYSELLKAKRKLRLEDLPAKQQERISLVQGSLMYKDKRIHGFDAVAVVEVIEHLEEDRLQAFERVLFAFAQPKTVVLTTPNQEYNVMWETLDAGEMRHTDHRFEWTRAEFQAWAGKVGKDYGYEVEYFAIGEEAENVGAPSQGVVFRKVK